MFLTVEEKVSRSFSAAHCNHCKSVRIEELSLHIGKVDVAYHIYIVQQYGLSSGKELSCCPNASSCVQKTFFFVRKKNFGIIVLLFYKTMYQLAKVMSIDNNMSYVAVYQFGDIAMQKRATRNFYKSFGLVFCEGHKAASSSCRKYHCFHGLSLPYLFFGLSTGYSILT